jgi:hypothetical protein
VLVSRALPTAAVPTKPLEGGGGGGGEGGGGGSTAEHAAVRALSDVCADRLPARETASTPTVYVVAQLRPVYVADGTRTVRTRARFR